MKCEHLAEGVTVYLGDCREVLPSLPPVDAVLSDPPYPNSAGHFVEAVEAARDVCSTFACPHWLVFWTEIEQPPVPLPLVAVHIWHRTNTNRPDNYEPVFEFREDGEKRASRVLPHSVVFPGLTGIEATGHPTEKNVSLMLDLVKRTSGIVLDPFMGSGTTGVAAIKAGRSFVGIEQDPKWFGVACKRIDRALRQPDLFIQPQITRQETLWGRGKTQASSTSSNASTEIASTCDHLWLPIGGGNQTCKRCGDCLPRNSEIPSGSGCTAPQRAPNVGKDVASDG
jgi:site-specific DNA-methyltransferase (adenine-specific)